LEAQLKIKDHLRESCLALAGAAAAVLVVSIWSGCAAPGANKTDPPMASRPAVKTAAATEAAPAPVAAAAQVPPAAVTADPNAPLHKLKAVVQSFAADSGTLVVKKLDGSTQEFQVAGAAKITKGGDFVAMSLSDLKKGDRISLGYRGSVVVSLHVKVVAAVQ
jgi:hypothetical protein